MIFLVTLKPDIQKLKHSSIADSSNNENDILGSQIELYCGGWHLSVFTLKKL